MHINDFPTELVEEIFLLSISQSQQYSHPSICRRSHASLSVISKTCRHWRDIALNCSPLWNHLHVVDPQQPSILQYLQVWMHRAGSLPLCLSLRQHQSYDLQASVVVFTFFLSLLHRCQSFEMFLLTDLKSLSLENIEKLPSTSLESVNVYCPNLPSTESNDTELLANLLLNDHNLRTVRWSCRLSSPLIPLSWEYLHELTTDNIGSLAEFLNALSQCQNLERLKILGDSNFSSTSGIIPRVSLPRVTHLSVVLGASAQRVLCLLLVPSLMDLEVVLLYRRSNLAPVLDLMQRSGVLPRRLGINNRIIPRRFGRLAEAEIVRALKTPYMQQLRVLEIEEPILEGRDIVKFLSLPTTAADGGDGPPGYLVYLERISLAFRLDTPEFNISQDLQDLIKSRLGILYDPETANEHVERSTLLRLSLSIPSA